MSRALSATKDSWSRRTNLGDTLPENFRLQHSSDKVIQKHQPMLDQSLSFYQFFLHTSLPEPKEINQRNQSKKNNSLLGHHFSPHTNPSSNHPPPKKKDPDSSPWNKYWSHSSVTFRRMRCRNSSNISQAAWGSSSLRRKTSKATATEVRGKRRRSSSTFHVVSLEVCQRDVENIPWLSPQQNPLNFWKQKKNI